MISFPLSIYHVIEGCMQVRSDVELQDRIRRGWSMVPVDRSPENILRARIAQHEAEVAQAKRALAIIKERKRLERKPENICSKCGLSMKKYSHTKCGTPKVDLRIKHEATVNGVVEQS